MSEDKDDFKRNDIKNADLDNNEGIGNIENHTHDEEIGYCNPPKDTQFKPGQSGNPNGRPRKNKGRLDLIREYTSKKIKLPNGEKIPRIHAVDRKLVAVAASGHIPAMKFLHTLITPSEVDFDDSDENNVANEKITRIIVRGVDARHPNTIAKEAAERAGGKFVKTEENKDD